MKKIFILSILLLSGIASNAQKLKVDGEYFRVRKYPLKDDLRNAKTYAIKYSFPEENLHMNSNLKNLIGLEGLQFVEDASKADVISEVKIASPRLLSTELEQTALVTGSGDNKKTVKKYSYKVKITTPVKYRLLDNEGTVIYEKIVIDGFDEYNFTFPDDGTNGYSSSSALASSFSNIKNDWLSRKGGYLVNQQLEKFGKELISQFCIAFEYQRNAFFYIKDKKSSGSENVVLFNQAYEAVKFYARELKDDANNYNVSNDSLAKAYKIYSELETKPLKNNGKIEANEFLASVKAMKGICFILKEEYDEALDILTSDPLISKLMGTDFESTISLVKDLKNRKKQYLEVEYYKQ
ncbi:hypothetical protein [Marinigracilibium pacificum]|uniref:Uncharacterized protein n=1 Tax=Marinigracilibium pacificum TaxID=2729599 RepID=A0A848J7T5_9BACT|nr:hypothetical protein [Marinigracilibium pacificum]NMM50484.1 hypothetical protein [Marinigracilibium pacificum]